MLRRAGFLATIALLASLLALGAACSDDGDDARRQDTPTAAGVTEGPPPDIREEDLSRQPEVAAFLADAGLPFDPTRVIYTDLTGDGVDEAVVPIPSGGEGGDVALFIYGYLAGDLAILLDIRPGGRSFAVDLEDGAVVVTEPRYEEGDPLCCPSSLHILQLEWDGGAFAITDERLEQQTPAKDGNE